MNHNMLQIFKYMKIQISLFNSIQPIQNRWQIFDDLVLVTRFEKHSQFIKHQIVRFLRHIRLCACHDFAKDASKNFTHLNKI